MKTAYAWNGEPIADIRQWCRERGEAMVVVQYTKRIPGFLSIPAQRVVWQEEMPVSFWEQLCIDPAYGIPEELHRYTP